MTMKTRNMNQVWLISALTADKNKSSDVYSDELVSDEEDLFDELEDDAGKSWSCF